MFYELLKNYDDILSVKEVQCILKIGKNQAYELVTNGDIQSIRIGRVYKIPKIYLLNYIMGYERKEIASWRVRYKKNYKVEQVSTM